MNIESLGTVLLDNETLQITKLTTMGTTLRVSVESNCTTGKCPNCGRESAKPHSHYKREPQDLPWGSWMIIIELYAKRFFCYNQQCEKKTFAEQFPNWLVSYGRQTVRAKQRQGQLALEMNAKTTERVLAGNGLAISDTTVNRYIRAMADPELEQPAKIIGIDDWAFRKGRNYGTIIVDHETGKPIDLLPERDSETVSEWLERYATITTITRDRSGEFGKAISEALPEATQIADRWHLLKNLREAVERHIVRRYATLRQIATSSSPIELEEAGAVQANPEVDTAQLVIKEVAASGGDAQSTLSDVEHLGKHRRYAPGPARETLHAARTKEKERLFAQVRARHAAGAFTTDIAKEFSLSRTVISQWVNSECLPPDSRGRYKHKCLIDDHTPYIRQRLDDGCTNHSQIWREIQEHGFTGTRTLVGKWIRQNYQTHDDASEPPVPKAVQPTIPSAKELSWLLVQHTDQLPDVEQLVNRLLQDANLAEFRQLAHRFMDILRNRVSEKYPSWLEDALKSTVQELKNFAIGLKRDADAVFEATRQLYNNGRTEGHVNRLKLIKRMMYGRANFDLLRKRVLLQGQVQFHIN